MHLQKIDFHCLRFICNFENWLGGPKDFHLYLYNTFAERKDKLHLYLAGEGEESAFFEGSNQLVTTKLTSQ